MTSTPASVAARPISDRLRAFVEDYPWERRGILEFMQRAADELPAGARVLDVGAGEAPYAELFAHLEYRTSDWEQSVHPGARLADYIGSADDLPIAGCQFDAVLNTQVLEHVADPASVMSELYRVLRPGGRLYMSAPLVWELHEEPYDFYRYTPHGLRHLAQRAGFVCIDVRPRNDTFTTIAQMLRNASYVMGRKADGLDQMREVAAHTLQHLSNLVASYAPLDTQHIFPLGYTLMAVRPRSLPNARTIAVGAFGSEVLDSPDLLERYVHQFTGADDATLVIVAEQHELQPLGALVDRLGCAAQTAADILAVEPDGLSNDTLHAVYSRRPAPPPLDAAKRYDDASIAELRAHVTRVLGR